MKKLLALLFIGALTTFSTKPIVKANMPCENQAWVCRPTTNTCSATTVEFEDGSSITAIVSGTRVSFKWPCL